MRVLQLTMITVFMAYGLAAPTTPKRGVGSSSEEDPVIAAGKTPPFNLDLHYCQTECDCSRFSKEEQYDLYFQCFTNPNCEECARLNMGPSN